MIETAVCKMKQSLCAVLTCVFTILPLHASSETLTDALVSAYNHSGLLEQNRAVLRAADEDVAQAVAALRPVISWSTALQYEYRDVGSSFASSWSQTANLTAGVNMQLLIYDFGRRDLQIDIAKETVLSTREQLISAEQTVLFAAVNAYMNVRTFTEILGLRENNVRVLKRELQAARDRFEVGEVTRTDVATAEARLAGARSALAQAKGDLQSAVERFRNVVGRKPGNLAPPPKLPKAPKSAAAAKATAYRNHPSLKAIQHGVKASEIAVELARRAKLPSVSLNAGVGLSDSLDSSSYGSNLNVGVTASGPIYQGGTLASAERKAIAQRDQQRGSLHVVRHDLAESVGVAYSNLLVSQSAISASQQQIRAAQVAFNGVREEATLGARTTLDVLNAEQELLDARANLVLARSTQYVAAYNLLQSMGFLTAERLKLPVKRYDPTQYYNAVKNAPTANSAQGKKLDRVLRALGKD